MLYIDGPSGRRCEEFNLIINPTLRSLISELDEWSQANSLPPIFITECMRTLDEQEELYFEYFKTIVERMSQGAKLSPTDSELALSMVDKGEIEMRQAARVRWSWHTVRCAVGIRTTIDGYYTIQQAKKLHDYLKSRVTPAACWEVIGHDLVKPHLHVAYRDFGYRQKFDPKKREAPREQR